jgi:hypothetical protein
MEDVNKKVVGELKHSTRHCLPFAHNIHKSFQTLFYMIPFTILTGFGISFAIVEGVRVHARITELLETERAYHELVEKSKIL